MKESKTNRETCYMCEDGPREILVDHPIVPEHLPELTRNKNIVEVCPTCDRKLDQLYGSLFDSKPDVHSDGYSPDNMKQHIRNLDQSDKAGVHEAQIESIVETHPGYDKEVRRILENLKHKGEIFESDEDGEWVQITRPR